MNIALKGGQPINIVKTDQNYSKTFDLGMKRGNTQTDLPLTGGF
jgi:hypothetical protein